MPDNRKARACTVPVALSAALALVLGWSGGPAAAQEHYQGKGLTMVVGFGAGGGIDTVARMFARHLAKHIGGEPSIVIQNMPGAAGINALNNLYRGAPTDGTLVAYDSWTPLSVIAKDKSVRFDYGKLTMIGALRTGTYVMFARKDVVPGGLAQPADIARAKGLVYAGQQPSLNLDIYGRLALDLMMGKGGYKYVPGYRSAPEIRLALERGEAGVTTHGLQGYRAGVETQYVKTGQFMPLWYFQRRDAAGRWLDDPDVPGMPTFLRIFHDAHGTEPAGIEWQALQLLLDLYGSVGNFIWGPPGMDARAAAALRKAFYAAAADPAFAAEQDKTFGFRYGVVPIDEAQKVVERLNNVAPDVAAFFQAFMR